MFIVKLNLKLLLSVCNSRNLWLFCFKLTQDRDLSAKLHLTHFTQGLDVNLVQANLSDLIPLFADLSTSSAQTKHDSPRVEGSNTVLPITEHVVFKSDSIFSDKSLFDDGMEESVNNVEHDRVMETNQMTEKDSEDTKARPVHSSQDSTDTGFSESQPKEEISKAGRGQGDGEGTEDSAEKGRKCHRKKPSNGMKSVLISSIAGGVYRIYNVANSSTLQGEPNPAL